MASNQPSDLYSKEETKQRMERALRGARITGHKPMSEIRPKRSLGKVDTKPTKAKKSK
jgi:hypothetical protein